MSEGLQVATPERVSLDLPIAGLGSRTMAYLLDVALMGAVILVLYFAFTFFVPDPVNAVLGLSRFMQTIGVSVLFFSLWIYWTAFEVIWKGQSPGKRLVQIRVVKADGSAVTVFAAAVRNFLRIVDFLPVCYPVGLITMLIDKRHRRLGDLLAGTVLVRDEKISLAGYEQLATGDSLEVDLLELGRNYLQRAGELEPEARVRIGRLLATRLSLTVADTASADEVVEAIRAKLGGA